MNCKFFAYFADSFKTNCVAEFDNVADAVALVEFMGNGFVTALVYEVK